MASSTLERLKPNTRVLVDASIFVYHFTGASEDCRDFLLRCEQGDLKGVASVITLAETAHRLMMLEALAKGRIKRPNVEKKLKSKPQMVRSLSMYEEQVEKIPLMGIEVIPLDQRLFLRSSEHRKKWGLLTNDSILTATAEATGITSLASADCDFEWIKDLALYRPRDT